MQLYLVQCSGPLAPHCYKSSNTVFEITNYIQCSAWDLWPLAFLNPVHLYSFMIPNQFQCCAQDLWCLPDCFHGHLLGNYTNIQVFFFFSAGNFIYIRYSAWDLQPLTVFIKSLSQITFIALYLETILQTHMLLFFIFIFQCGAWSLAFAVYIIFAQSLLFQMWCFRTFILLHFS